MRDDPLHWDAVESAELNQHLEAGTPLASLDIPQLLIANANHPSDL